MDRGLVLKRFFDLAVSVPALVLSLPVQAVIALAVRLSVGRPVLFRQRRPGLHGEVFELVKFRTMHHEDASRGRTDDATRLTTTGRVLRKLSLDELPSLWNIVRGDMSLVGPRPLLERYLDRYTVEQARRHEVRPGLTGLAQVSGRNQVSWEDKLRLDVEYVDTRSFMGDLRILAATARQVVRGSGVSAVGEATMPEFQGTPATEDHL